MTKCPYFKNTIREVFQAYGCHDCDHYARCKALTKRGPREQAVRDFIAKECRECHRRYLTDEDGCGDKMAGLSWGYVCSEGGCPYTMIKEILRGDYDK